MTRTKSGKPYEEGIESDPRLAALYGSPMRATRSGPLFNAFPYPTKISPEAISLFLASHTAPGQTVFDGFSGSGTTGLATILCARPTDDLKREAKRLGIPARWGERRAVLYEISSLGAFIAKALCSPPDPCEFQRAAEQILADVEQRCGWLYQAKDPSSTSGEIRYTVWADVLLCPSCRRRVSLWDACVSRNPAEIATVFRCPRCLHTSPMESTQRVIGTEEDDLLGVRRSLRLRQPAWVYGMTKGRNWARQPDASDIALLDRIAGEPLPSCVPEIAVPWGDLYRSGYHEGITHLHHFYTRRNLIAFGSLWAQVEQYPSALRHALHFWLLSYNASHTTIMTRVVAKKGQKDLVVTSAQPGVLYVSGLPVEKNVFHGLRRKLKTIAQAFRITRASPRLVEVRNASSLAIDMPDNSVDYVFTDPPFGGNIPYAEVNFLNEAWLGFPTATEDEVTISPHQGKGIADYCGMLTQAFREIHRILRKDGKATVVFHSSTAEVWNALQTAFEGAGFAVDRASVLNKTQGSFKQVTSAGSVKGDPLILLSKKHKASKGRGDSVRIVTERLLRQAEGTGDPTEMTAQRLYSRLVGHYVAQHQQVPVDAADFYKQLAERQTAYGTAAL